MRRIRILFEAPSAILPPLSCRGGGTGRRAGFKIRFLCGSAGSIPALGTTEKLTAWLLLALDDIPYARLIARNSYCCPPFPVE